MSEADTSADVHQTVHDELQADVIPAIKSWQKTKYIKSMMHIKCTKEYEEEFKRVSNTSLSSQETHSDAVRLRLGTETVGEIVHESR